MVGGDGVESFAEVYSSPRLAEMTLSMYGYLGGANNESSSALD
jgi:hypothetical protein